MKEYRLNIVAQSAELKTTPSGSKDTGIFFPQELLDVLDQEADFKFTIYKIDFIKAVVNILSSLPLYSNKGGNKITHDNLIKECERLMTIVNDFFKNSDTAEYRGKPFTLSITTGERKYLYGLEQGNFSIRNFLIANFSTLLFQKEDDGNIILRCETKNTKGLEALSLLHNNYPQKIDDIAENCTFNFYLTAMRTKPFLLLAGISGTGKSRIVKEMAFASCPPSLQKDEVTPGNYCMIEVKPNWHDSSELIGYVSNIPTPHYVVTPFINFLIKAMHYPKAPFFVCLDEMNLAPVEQYFAEFLSVLESRKLVNGEIVSEPLIKPEIFGKKTNFDSFKQAYYGKSLAPGGLAPEEYAPLWNDLGEKGLRLPPNVIVVGTVNMDETTYQFSRKVIDRAMTIEMNDVNFGSMFEDKPDTLKYRDPFVKAVNFLPKFTAAKDALESMSDADRTYLKDNVPTILNALDSALDNTPFKIAYRVENELILYFNALREESAEATAETLLATAIDEIMMMKVLPRIEGNEDALKEALERLADFTRETYPKAHKKVVEMKERLKVNHFTSFWP